MRTLSPRDIGALTRETRLEAGLTQAQLGEKIGASRFWVSEFERGKPWAEWGLALRALKALDLALTIEPRELALRREERERKFNRTPALDQPVVDLSALLNRLTKQESVRSTTVETPRSKRRARTPNRS